MRNFFWAGCLFALTASSACGSNENSQASADPASTASKSQPLVLRNDSAGLVQTVNANGITIRLGRHFEHAMLVRQNADGSSSVECHDEQATAEAFLQGRTASAHLEEK